MLADVRFGASYAAKYGQRPLPQGKARGLHKRERTDLDWNGIRLDVGERSRFPYLGRKQVGKQDFQSLRTQGQFEEEIMPELLQQTKGR